MKTLNGILKAIYTNRWDIVALVFWPLLFLTVNSLVSQMPGGWVCQNGFYALAMFSICVHAPWVFMSVAAPNTWGAFINRKWEIAFAFLGGKSSRQETLQFLVVWGTYLVFVVTLGIICVSVFLGTPASG